MAFFTGKRLLVLGLILFIAVGIPVTLFFVGQQTQPTTQATPATTLSFVPATKNVTAGEVVKLDISMNPGSNQVIATTLHITYDQTKLATTGAGLKPNFVNDPTKEGFTEQIEAPIYTPGNITIVMGTGIDPTKALKSISTIADITFQVLQSATAGTTDIKFGAQTTVSSSIDPEQNVLSTSSPAVLTIAAVPTATVAPNQVPVCTAFTTDRTPSGALDAKGEFSLAFTATGNDPDGTISKVTFQYGDGPTEDVTTGGGIGTKNVSLQKSHSYKNAGTFTATAIFTDNANGVSVVGVCTQTVTVTATGGVATPAATLTPVVATPTETPTPTPTETPTPTPTDIVSVTITPPGPGSTFVGLGILGAIVTIIGAAIFLAL